MPHTGRRGQVIGEPGGDRCEGAGARVHGAAPRRVGPVIVSDPIGTPVDNNPVHDADGTLVGHQDLLALFADPLSAKSLLFLFFLAG